MWGRLDGMATLTHEQGSPRHRLLWRVASWFCGRKRIEQVHTLQHLEAAPERCWSAVVFYEEIPLRAPWLLRLLLPAPLRTAGAKSQPGALVECVYDGGSLTKRITRLDPPHEIAFEVLKQKLGIEACVCACDGSYVLEAEGTGTLVTLMTRYRTRLHPRWAFRPVERAMMHLLHRYVLRGLEASLAKGSVPGEKANAARREGETDDGTPAIVDTVPAAEPAAR